MIPIFYVLVYMGLNLTIPLKKNALTRKVLVQKALVGNFL